MFTVAMGIVPSRPFQAAEKDEANLSKSRRAGFKPSRGDGVRRNPICIQQIDGTALTGCGRQDALQESHRRKEICIMSPELMSPELKSEAEFHQALISAFNLPAHYGANLDALWDIMTTDVERPVHLVWQNASVSRAAMPEKFESIVALLKDVEKQDSDFGWSDRFTISLNN